MSYNMYVRDLSLNLKTKINKKLEKIKKNKKMKSKKFFGINFSLVNVKNAFNIMSKDLKNNGNIIFTKNKDMNLVKLKKFYKDKRVFITGHTGFKGSWLTAVL